MLILSLSLLLHTLKVFVVVDVIAVVLTAYSKGLCFVVIDVVVTAYSKVFVFVDVIAVVVTACPQLVVLLYIILLSEFF